MKPVAGKCDDGMHARRLAKISSATMLTLIFTMDNEGVNWTCYCKYRNTVIEMLLIGYNFLMSC